MSAPTRKRVNIQLKAENVLKRAIEFETAGKTRDAYQLLQDTILNRKIFFRTWTEVFEEIIVKLIDLSILFRRVGDLRLTLSLFRNVCQNSGTFENLSKAFDHALEAAEALVSKSLNAMEAPLPTENKSEETKIINERQLLEPRKRFLWDCYRTVVDVLRQIHKLEPKFHELSQKAMQFCLDNNKKSDFYKFLESIRMFTLAQLKRAYEEPDPEKSQGMYLLHFQTRFKQLYVSCELDMWQEALKCIEDIVTLSRTSSVLPDFTFMIQFYEQVVRVFTISKNYTFLTYSYLRLYSNILQHQQQQQEQQRQQQQVVEGKEQHKLEQLAMSTILSCLCIPTSDYDNKNHSESEIVIAADENEDEVRKKNIRIANMLGFSVPPCKSTMLHEIRNKFQMFSKAPQEIHNLYQLLLVDDVDNDPRALCQKVSPILDYIRQQPADFLFFLSPSASSQKKMSFVSGADYFINGLKEVTIRKYTQQLFRTTSVSKSDIDSSSCSVKIEDLKKQTEGFYSNYEEFERYLTQYASDEISRKGLSNHSLMKIDHQNGVIHFQTVEADVQDILIDFAQRLFAIRIPSGEHIIGESVTNNNIIVSSGSMLNIEKELEEERLLLMKRRLFCERKKQWEEDQERGRERLKQEKLQQALLQQEKEEEDRRRKEAVKREEERKRQEEERKRQDEARQQLRLLEAQLAAGASMADGSSIQTKPIVGSKPVGGVKQSKALVEKTPEELLKEKREEIEREKVKREKRLLEDVNNFDYLERVRREVEIPKIQQNFEQWKLKDKKDFQLKMEQAKATFLKKMEHELQEKDRLSKYQEAKEKFVETFLLPTKQKLFEEQMTLYKERYTIKLKEWENKRVSISEELERRKKMELEKKKRIELEEKERLEREKKRMELEEKDRLEKERLKYAEKERREVSVEPKDKLTMPTSGRWAMVGDTTAHPSAASAALERGKSTDEESQRGRFTDNEPKRGRFTDEEPRKGRFTDEEPRKGRFTDEEPKKGRFTDEEPRKGRFTDEEPRKGRFTDEEPKKGRFTDEEPSKSSKSTNSSVDDTTKQKSGGRFSNLS